MKPLYKVMILLVLAATFVLFSRDFGKAPLIHGRLFAMFLMGAVMALFVQGPRYGTLDPISTRPIMVMLGVVLMGTSLLWSFALRGHL